VRSKAWRSLAAGAAEGPDNTHPAPCFKVKRQQE
jgi:hypothetical protein